MATPRVSLAPKDRHDVPPGAILVMVEPGSSELEDALVKQAEQRSALRKLRGEERSALGKVLRAGGRRIGAMIRKFRGDR